MVGNYRPDYEFSKEWLDKYVEVIILFAVNSGMSYAQVDRILRQKIEAMGVDIIEN